MSKHESNEEKFILQKNINDIQRRICGCNSNIEHYKNQITQEIRYKEIYQREYAKLIEEIKGL